jgi:hypothetical protein
MVWIILNIVLLIIGVGLVIAGNYVGSVNAYTSVPEDISDITECLLCCAGVVCLAFLVVSEPLRWWLG